MVDQRTLDDPEDIQVPIIRRHTARRESVLAVPEKVLADLRVSHRLHVIGGAINAAARLVDAYYVHGFIRGPVGEFARQVGVKAL